MTDPLYLHKLTIPGTAVGKGRPRFNTRTGRAYTDQKTRVAENDIRAIWREAGSPRLPDGWPISVEVIVVMKRPASHYLGSGALSAAGRRSVYPIRKPDADNCAKLVCDALNGLAYKDDAQITDLEVRRRWAEPGGAAFMEIWLGAVGAQQPEDLRAA